jgi:hypothetical protein
MSLYFSNGEKFTEIEHIMKNEENANDCKMTEIEQKVTTISFFSSIDLKFSDSL